MNLNSKLHYIKKYWKYSFKNIVSDAKSSSSFLLLIIYRGRDT